MFFDNIALAPRKGATLKRPPIADNGWRPPAYFPDLSDAVAIGFDTESKDLEFLDQGPGWARGTSHMVGFSIAALSRSGEMGKWYFPIRHECEGDWNLNPQACLHWLRQTMATPHIPKVAANLLIDIGTLIAEGVVVQGELHDVQFAEALIDETALVALEALGEKYLGRGKTDDAMADWSRQAYGGGKDQRGNIWRCPPRLVGPYGEDDAAMPLAILPLQWPQLEAEGLAELYRMECDSVPMLIEMRRRGVPIDVNRAGALYDKLAFDVRDGYDKLAHVSGVRIDSVAAAAQVALCFDAVGIRYPKTAEGAPSFRKEWLKEQLNPVADAINEIRELEKLRSTFLRGYLLEGNINGRVHTQFHPLRNDDNGAKTGRYASSTPNLQNIPVRTDNGKLIRQCFIPEYGHLCWEKNDHSQIEYRMLAHFAEGPGAADLRAEYAANPDTDYHDRVMVRWCSDMGKDLATMGDGEKKKIRRPIKNINFGLIYGQTIPSLAYKAGMSPEQAKVFFAAYFEAAPYVKPTMEATSREVQGQGYVQTIGGRRSRFNLWEPFQRIKGEARRMALPYEMALNAYGSNIIRAYAYRGTNYKFQGSAADCLKWGMHDCYKAGVFDVIGYPLLQVHDELDFSVIDDSPMQREGYREMRHRLENPSHVGPRLRVPLRVDHDRAANWGLID